MSDISVPDELGYLVRITDETGRVLGTGITVAPGQVLTSLHLVGPRWLADPDARINVTPAAGGPALPAVIGYADGELDLAMLYCTPRSRSVGRLGPSRDIQVGGNVEVLVPSGRDILVRLETEWLGSHTVDQSGPHSHVRAPQARRELGLSGSPVALPSDGSVVGLLLAAEEDSKPDLRVVPGEQLAEFTRRAARHTTPEPAGLLHDQVRVLARYLLEVDDVSTAADIHSLLGRAAQRTRNLDHAHDFYLVALTCFDRVGDRDAAAAISFRIGQVAETGGRWWIARERYEQAVRRYAEMGQTRGVASGLQRLGLVVLLCGEPGEALSYLERALSAYQLTGDTTGFAVTLAYLGAAAAAAGDRRAALTYLDRCRSERALPADRLDTFVARVTRPQAVDSILVAVRDWRPIDEPGIRISGSGHVTMGNVATGSSSVYHIPIGTYQQNAPDMDPGLALESSPVTGGGDVPPDEPWAARGEDDDDPQIINIWVGERENNPAVPLAPRQPYTLVFRVGRPRADNLADGPRDIPRSLIPADGLETSWIVASTDVVLSQAKDESSQVSFDHATSGTTMQWMACFTLTVPPGGDSEERRITIAALDPGRARIDVSVSVHGDEYRRLTVDLEVASPTPAAAPPAPGRSGGGPATFQPRAVTTTVVHGPPLRQLALRPSADWQEPPKQLSVIFYSASALVACEKKGVSHTVRWAPAIPSVEGRIRQVRDTLDALRIKQNGYFEGVSPEELAERLATFRPTAEWGTGTTSDRWAAVSSCPELRDLADEGHLLYSEIFGSDGDLRQYVDDLGPGDMLTLTWHGDSHRIAHVPWALMYRTAPAPGEPIDPGDFLGIRLRLNYIAQEMRYNRAVGGAAAQATYLLYWGREQTDPVAAETSRHRDELDRGEQRFLPTCHPGKPEVLGFLGDPAPSPVGLVYLYSRALSGTETGFRFGNGLGPEDTITLREIGSRKMSDRPLVFANACGTAGASAYVPNEIEARFFLRGASAFIGTECRVPIAFAARFAAAFFHFLHAVEDKPTPAGEALAQARRFFFTEYGCLGGLFYSYVNDYYIFLASDEQVAELSRLKTED
jgi:hypothetical protein